jgi:hypothetical protein
MATTTKSAEKPVKSKPAAAKAATPVKPAAPAKSAAPAKAAAPAKPAAKPAVAKPVASAAPAKAPAATAAKPAAPKKEAAPAKAKLTPLAHDQRRFYVEVAAYYIAERRGFHGESQLNDWVEAENEIDRLLSEGILNP